MMEKGGYVYILSNYTRTTFYIGVTSDLQTRIQAHIEGNGSSFTRKYNCRYLVYFETHHTIIGAIEREKQLKGWHREWKLNLIKSINPSLNDLTDEIY
jgi:putative endonuclease